VLDVVDDGRGLVGDGPIVLDGHGLVGMRERVALYGGILGAGPRPEHGFAVTARFPVPVTDAATALGVA
jgi:signal transduction histidine kinase